MQFAPATLRGDMATASRNLYMTSSSTPALENTTLVLSALMRQQHWDELGIRHARVVADPSAEGAFKVLAKAASGDDFEIAGQVVPNDNTGPDAPRYRVVFANKSIGEALVKSDQYKKPAGSVADVMPLAAAVVNGTKVGNNGDHAVSLYKMPAGTTLQRLEQVIAKSGRPNVVIKSDDGTYYVMESRVLSRGLFGLSGKPGVGDTVEIPRMDGTIAIKGKIEAVANLNLKFVSGVQTVGYITAAMAGMMLLVVGIGEVLSPFAALMTLGAVGRSGFEVGLGHMAMTALAGGVATGLVAGRFISTRKNELPDMAVEIERLQPF